MLFLLIIASSCKKDEIEEVELTTEENETSLPLTKQISGKYEGVRYYEKEHIVCQPDCTPPCDFNYYYDTSGAVIEIEYFNNDSVEVKDLTFDYAKRRIPIDFNLHYFGHAPSSAPIGHFKLYFEGPDNDSLIIEIKEGGGNSCGATVYDNFYKLEKL